MTAWSCRTRLLLDVRRDGHGFEEPNWIATWRTWLRVHPPEEDERLHTVSTVSLTASASTAPSGLKATVAVRAGGAGRCAHALPGPLITSSCADPPGVPRSTKTPLPLVGP